MKNIGAILTIGSAYAVFFQVSVYLGLANELIFTLFSISPLLLLFMAYMILKFGKPSTNTFDEMFYEHPANSRSEAEDLFSEN